MPEALPPGVAREPAGHGRESVWDYPRPAVARAEPRRLQVLHRGAVVADTCAGVAVLETSHPPSYYFPPGDIAASVRPAGRTTLCEWKGRAETLDVVAGGAVLEGAAWRYPTPTPAFAAIAGFVAFHPAAFDACLVDGMRAAPQAGGFYGGWITPDLAGPFKGGPGSRFW